MRESPYTVLGLKKGCTREEVKDAYYRQAKQWHPDNNKTKFASERFHKAQRAMKTLLDESVRISSMFVGRAGVQCVTQIWFGALPNMPRSLFVQMYH